MLQLAQWPTRRISQLAEEKRQISCALAKWQQMLLLFTLKCLSKPMEDGIFVFKFGTFIELVILRVGILLIGHCASNGTINPNEIHRMQICTEFYYLLCSVI